MIDKQHSYFCKPNQTQCINDTLIVNEIEGRPWGQPFPGPEHSEHPQMSVSALPVNTGYLRMLSSFVITRERTHLLLLLLKFGRTERHAGP